MTCGKSMLESICLACPVSGCVCMCDTDWCHTIFLYCGKPLTLRADSILKERVKDDGAEWFLKKKQGTENIYQY